MQENTGIDTARIWPVGLSPEERDAARVAISAAVLNDNDRLTWHERRNAIETYLLALTVPADKASCTAIWAASLIQDVHAYYMRTGGEK